MNDLEIEKLTKLADDEVLFRALRKELLDSIPQFVWTENHTNEQIGAALRAHDTAEEFIKKGLTKLRQQYQSAEPKGVDKLNPGV